MLGPRFMPLSVFYTQSVMLGPRFMPLSVIYTQSVVRILQSAFCSPQSTVHNHVLDRPEPYDSGPCKLTQMLPVSTVCEKLMSIERNIHTQNSISKFSINRLGLRFLERNNRSLRAYLERNRWQSRGCPIFRRRQRATVAINCFDKESSSTSVHEDIIARGENFQIFRKERKSHKICTHTTIN